MQLVLRQATLYVLQQTCPTMISLTELFLTEPNEELLELMRTKRQSTTIVIFEDRLSFVPSLGDCLAEAACDVRKEHHDGKVDYITALYNFKAKEEVTIVVGACMSISGVASDINGISKPYIINRVMERPFLLDLQYLLNKFAESASLIPTDVSVLDRCHNAMTSTEVANTSNQIYLLIAESNNERFFACFETIVSHTADTRTRSLILSLLSTRIRKEWSKFEQCYKDGLKQYVVNEIRKNLDQGGDASVLLHLNQVLVGMLRFQWDSLLKDFVSNMAAAGTDLPLSILLNNLTILRLLLEEGFNTIEERVSPYEFQRFRDSLDQDMRCVLKLLCQCLQSEGAERPAKVRKCLDTIRLAVDNISAFELFNCSIIELLVGLIGNQEFRRPLITCFEEIFRFKQASTPNNSHSKIAEKLLLILEAYLEQYEAEHRVDYFSDKETVSTEDSFHSRRTRKRKQRKADYADLLGLLYEFLTRYVPFMDKARGEEDLEIEYETNIKLYFSQDLYEAFGLIYWRLVQFVMHIADHFDTLIFVDNDEQSLEEKRRVVCCLRLMLAMHSKLKLEVRTQIKSMIEVCIVNFAPVCPEFASFYLHYGLLKNGSETLTKQPLSSSDLEEEFMEFLRTILVDRATCRLFAELIQQNIEYYDEEQSIEKDRKKIPWEMGKDMEKYQTLRAINVINRMCWSLIYSFRCNPQAIKNISVFSLNQTLTKSTQLQSYMDLQRCYGLNAKFILQVFYPDNHNYPAIMKTIGNSSQFVTEFSLVILSKILIADNACTCVEFSDLEMMIEKLHEVEALDIDKDRIMKLYPGIVRVLIGKLETAVNKVKVKEILDDMITKEIANLKGFSSIDQTRDQPELRWTIYVFKRLKQISNLLVQEFSSSKPPRHALVIINWARKIVQTVIFQFQFKHKHFGKHLRLTDKENFDLLHLIEFRKHYIELSRCFIAMISASVGLERDSRGPRQNKDSSGFIALEQGQRQDFMLQTQFKQKEYLLFALEFYRWAIVSSVDSYEELINASVSTIADCLQGWEGDSEVQREKYVFWKEVVSIFCLKLNKKNREYLVRLYGDFQLKNTLSSSIELILEVYQELINVLNEQCIKGFKPLKFPEFTNFFITTFETLFSSVAKHAPIFDRITHLFFSQIDFLTCLSTPLEPNSKKDNNQIAFILIRSHICRHLPLQDNEEHHAKLVRVFRERKYARWQAEIKDYVAFVNRICEESQNQRS